MGPGTAKKVRRLGDVEDPGIRGCRESQNPHTQNPRMGRAASRVKGAPPASNTPCEAL
jgi:hypothetical protein